MSTAYRRVRGPVPFWLSLLVVLCLGGWSGAVRSQVTLNATADAYTKSVDPNLNFGDRDDFRAQNWASIRGFVRVDTAAFPASAASSAVLELYVEDVGGATTIDIHKVLGDWGEVTLTHNNQPAYAAQAGASFPVSSADIGTTLSVDITGLFNQLLAEPANDYGLVLRTSYLNLVMAARETGNGLRILATPAGGASNQAPGVDAGADRTAACTIRFRVWPRGQLPIRQPWTYGLVND